ncbi:acetate kinase [Spirochaetia bacterium 38H-sp]|uniref:Acetate kinase n=1 Tax=Rarispira pelagica TaxID=3141764 RepID=A0ABU9UDT7_9SPIR
MVIMTLNCGSSSVKYQIYDWDNKTRLASGVVERVTQKGSAIEHEAKGKPEYKKEHDCPDHKEAIKLIMEAILDPEYGAIKDPSEIKAVGHRVVHGGEKFASSVIITDEVIKGFKEIAHLAPLHNPANIQGIEAAKDILPDVPHCAIMDTAWHQTMPASSYIYALPYEWYTKYGVRRYGFHGTSFLYTSRRAAVLLGKKPSEANLIIAHIGNGASINAVKNGCSYDTSMGLTPLEGLVMGTRSGDIDPAIPFYMMNQTGMSPAEMETALNKKSGVLGITSKWVDRRDVEIAAEKGDQQAILCQKIEAYRIRKYVGAYMAALGRVDAIVFTAGVGEKGPITRQMALEGLENLGIKLDPERNKASMTRNAETIISTDDSPVKVFVIPTDEEMVMTEDTYALLNNTYDVHTNFTYSFESPDYVNKDRLEKLPKDLKKWQGLDKIILNKK